MGGKKPGLYDLEEWSEAPPIHLCTDGDIPTVHPQMHPTGSLVPPAHVTMGSEISNRGGEENLGHMSYPVPN